MSDPSVPTPSPATTTLSLTIPYSVIVPQGHPVEETDRYIASLCEDAANSQRCQVAYSRGETTTFVPVNHPKPVTQHVYTITVVGPVREAISTRGIILRNNLSQTTVSVRAFRRFLMSPNGSIKPIVKKRLDQIMKQSQCHLNVLDPSSTKVPGPSSSRDTTDIMEIEITGVLEAVERARIETLVLLDELSGLHVEAAEIDPKLHNLIAGRKRLGLKQIMQDTSTNIYLPSPFAFQPSRDGGVALEDREKILIWITGERYDVQIAKETLMRNAEAKKTLLKSQQAMVSPRKIDWMLTNRKKELKKILRDNATFVVFPPLGIHHNLVTVYGDDKVTIARTLRQIMLLATQFYVSCLQLGLPAFTLLNLEFHQPSQGESSSNPMAKSIQNMLSQISLSSRAEIVLKINFVEIYGSDIAVKSAFEQLIELDWVQMHVRDTKFQVELAIEHHEFISGKKNGKINKIIRQTGCRVTFQENYNGLNMLLDVLNPYPSKALEGLAMLEDELPAEISFSVPEAFHKRIIGVGGKNIQRVMKRFGVYVKFSNAEEFAELGGYFENEDNVIARTPNKNSNNLESLRLSVMDQVHVAKENRDVEVMVHVPRDYHRAIAGRNGYNVREIEKRTRAATVFPDKETGSSEIVLKGPEIYINQAKTMVLDYIPDVSLIYVPGNSNAREVLASDEFVDEVGMRAKRDFDVDVLACTPKEIEDGEHFWVVLESKRNNPNLDPCRKWIVDYLAAKHISVEHIDNGRPVVDYGQATITQQQQPQSQQGNPVVTEAFHHFNSKLFAPVQPEPQGFNYSLFDTEGFRASRGVGSAPNLRSIFDETGRPINPVRKSQSELTENLFMDAINNRARRLTDSSYDGPPPMAGYPSVYDSPTTYFPPSAPFTPVPTPGSASVEDSGSSGHEGSPPRTSISPDGQMSPPRMSSSMRAWSPPRTVDRAVSPPRRSSPLRSYSPIEEIFESPDPSDAEEGVISDDMLRRILQMGMAEEVRDKDREYGPVKMILEGLGLQKHVHQFVEQEIDFGTFKNLDDGDLQTIGVKTLGARKKILRTIQSLQAGSSPTS